MMRSLATTLILLSLVGCASKSTGPSTTAPQARVLQWDRAFADAVNVAAKTTTTLLDAKRIDIATANQVKTWATVAVKISEDVATEANSTDSWTVMRQKLATMLAQSAVKSVPVGNPDLKAALDNALNLYGQILKEVQ